MTATAIRERFVSAGGFRVHCATAGEGRPIVLVHGWPTSSLLWRGVLPRLAARGRVIAPDLPGFGRSIGPPGASYSLDAQARRLGEVLDQLDAREVALVLHDLGGPIGMLWAVRHPERVARLVVLNTLLYPDSRAARLFMPTGSFASRARAILGVERVPVYLKAAAIAAHAPGLGTLLFGRPTVRLAVRLGCARPLDAGVAAAHASAYATPEARRALARTFLDPRGDELHEIVRGLGRLRAPALVVCGRRDRLLPGVRSELARLATDLPAGRFELLPHAGHFVPEDEPEEVALLVERMLEGWSG